jgi:site-specific DNA-methyltransferase (adenine-specific)
MTARARTGSTGWRVVCADTLRWLPDLPDASIDAVVTDPPYGISFDHQHWDGSAIHEAIAATGEHRLSDGQAFERWTTLWATELARILRPGAHLVAFAAPRMSHRLTSGMEDAGLEIRDVLMWLYGEGMPKSRRLPGGQGTALKPAYEPIVLARRPFTGPAAHNVGRHGTGALNIDPCRIPPHHLNQSGPAAHHDGGRAVEQNGRWPANLMLGHAPSCRPRRCSPTCPARRLDTQAATARARGGCPGPSRFFYCAKASRRERDAGCHHLPTHHLDLFPNAHPRRTRPRHVRNAHPTVKPVDLMRWLVRLACPTRGLVLDPFCGSGTTGIAAILEHRRFLGIELDRHHAELATARIAHWAAPGADSP